MWQQQRCVIESVSWTGVLVFFVVIFLFFLFFFLFLVLRELRVQAPTATAHNWLWPTLCVSERWIKSFKQSAATMLCSALPCYRWLHNVRVALNFRHRKAELCAACHTISTRTTTMTTATTGTITTVRAATTVKHWQCCVADKNKSCMQLAWNSCKCCSCCCCCCCYCQ